MLNIVLYEPEIPANTGNIGRSCVAVGARLHLIEPLGFILSDRYLKRAGMDYWDRLDVRRYVDFQDFLEKNPEARPGAGTALYIVETMSPHLYTEAEYPDNCYLMFGSESTGVPEEIMLDYRRTCVRIPMLPGTRSMNLSDCVSIAMFEVLRHQGFPGLQTEGELKHLTWRENRE